MFITVILFANKIEYLYFSFTELKLLKRICLYKRNVCWYILLRIVLALNPMSIQNNNSIVPVVIVNYLIKKIAFTNNELSFELISTNC